MDDQHQHHHPTWHLQMDTLPVASANHTSTYIGANQILIVGGLREHMTARIDDSSLNTVLLYDVSAKQITPQTPLRYSINSHTTILKTDDDDNRHMFILGGRRGHLRFQVHDLNDVVICDVLDDTYDYHYTNDMMIFGRHCHMSISIGEGIYSIGGGVRTPPETLWFNEDSTVTPQVHLQDGSKSEVMSGTIACNEEEDVVYVFGGHSFRNLNGLTQILTFHPDDEECHEVLEHPNAMLPLPLCGLASVTVANWVILIGGCSMFGTERSQQQDFSVSNACYIFDTKTDSFLDTSDSPLLNNPRHSHSATLLDNGRIIVLGGIGVNDNGDEYFLNTEESIHYTALFPYAIRQDIITTPNEDQKLPIHIAAEHDLKWVDGMNMLVEEYPMSLMIHCGHGNLPIVYASSGADKDLSNIFEMLLVMVGHSIELIVP
jgi:hypothetical protein